MATKRRGKSTAWMDDGDDAHFVGNPAYKPTGRKSRMTTKAETGGPKAGRAKRPTGQKRVSTFKNSPTFDRIYGNPQKSPRKTVRKRVFVKE